jgi:hypothetical protein
VFIASSGRVTRASAAAWRGFILFLLELWIAGSDAGGMIDARTREFGISWLAFLKAPESSRAVKLRRVAILVLEFCERLLAVPGTLKVGNDAPTGNWSGRIDRMRNRGVRRHHQVPAHKRERGCMTGSHLHFLAGRSANRKQRMGKLGPPIESPFRTKATYGNHVILEAGPPAFFDSTVVRDRGGRSPCTLFAVLTLRWVGQFSTGIDTEMPPQVYLSVII